MPNKYYILRPRQGRNRKSKSLNTWMRSITRIDEDVFEKTITMTASLKSLRTAKERLRNCIDKVIQYENELREEKESFKKDTEELREVSQDILNLYKFEGKEQTLLNLHTTFAMEDVFAAEKQIKKVEDELENMSPIVKDPTADDPNAPARCYDQIFIPQLTTSKMSQCLEQSKTDHLCSICLENPADCVIVECGHVSMCQSCVPEFVHQADDLVCPICRAQFRELVVPAPL